MMRIAAAGVVAGAMLAACGGGSPLPEVPACATPAVTATPSSARSAVGIYFRGVTTGTAELETSLAAFRATYPDGKFYRGDHFRPDFVLYAANALCRIDAMATLAPPETADEGTLAFEAELEAILRDYRTQLERGLNAIRQRNTSDYRDFNRNVDTVAARLRALLDSR